MLAMHLLRQNLRRVRRVTGRLWKPLRLPFHFLYLLVAPSGYRGVQIRPLSWITVGLTRTTVLLKTHAVDGAIAPSSLL